MLFLLYAAPKFESQIPAIEYWVENYVGTKELLDTANVRRLANVSAFVDESESIGAVLGLQASFRVSSQDGDLKSD
jgi:hypothetical protein